LGSACYDVVSMVYDFELLIQIISSLSLRAVEVHACILHVSIVGVVMLVCIRNVSVILEQSLEHSISQR
jgi:hypothetical protein